MKATAPITQGTVQPPGDKWFIRIGWQPRTPVRYAQAEKRQQHSKLTIIWNIKLGMKNENDRQITRHSLPTRMYFNFLTHRTKILKFYCQPTNGTFSFALTHNANASSKSKEPFFATVHRFFSCKGEIIKFWKSESKQYTENEEKINMAAEVKICRNQVI